MSLIYGTVFFVLKTLPKTLSQYFYYITQDTSEVKLRIKERYTVTITTAFRCQGIWPRSAAHWPALGVPWPSPNVVHEVKQEGFDLTSREPPSAAHAKQPSLEGDAWLISFTQAEDLLLATGCRRKCFSVLKTLRDR